MDQLEQHNVIQVLLVDDDEGDRELTSLTLARSTETQFHLEFADRLSRAEAMVKEKAYDVILMDLGLPESQGLETLRHIESIDWQAPIIVLTDLQDDRVSLASLNRGVQDYLLKSDITLENLSRSMRYAIQRHEMLQQLSTANALLAQKNAHLARLCDTAQKFVDNVSHEFRTPLTVIKEYVSLLRDGIVGETELDAEQCRFLDVVTDRADDLNTMVDDMLDVSKLEAGLLDAWRRPCSISDVVQRIRPNLEKKAAVKHMELHISMATDLPQVFCDPEKLGRIIINLAVNAIKFCGDPGVVEIWARTDPACPSDVMVGITDNGPGICEEDRKVICDRFEQLGNQGRGSCKGFGLGLNIVKELVDLNFGQLHIDSTLGVGSTFSFTVPRAIAAVVFQRYVEHLQQPPQGPPFLTLLKVSLDDCASSQSVQEAGKFLNYLLRGRDLLFHLEHRRWVILLATPDFELHHFLERAAQELVDANRNRPGDPLPEIQYEQLGSWSLENRIETILAGIQSGIRGRELTCAS